MADLVELGFTLFMILFPVAFGYGIRLKPDVGRDASGRDLQIRTLSRRLYLGTGAALLMVLAVYFTISTVFAHYLWVAFFPLWFLFAMPLIQAKDPGWRPLEHAPKERSASLKRRDMPTPALRLGWIVTGIIWLVLTAMTVVFLRAGTPQATWWILVFPGIAAVNLGGFIWAMRRSMLEPEPMVAEEPTQLREARARLYLIKITAWYGLGTLMILVFCIPALLIAWKGDAMLMAAIVIGAGGGALAGIAGGVVGTTADLQRAKINRIYRALTSDAAEVEVGG